MRVDQDIEQEEIKGMYAALPAVAVGRYLDSCLHQVCGAVIPVFTTASRVSHEQDKTMISFSIFPGCSMLS